MNGIIYVRVTQYQKHLIKDLLADHEINLIFNSSMAEDIIVLRCDPFGTIITHVEIKNLSDSEYSVTLVVMDDILKMVNGEETQDIVKDKIYLAKTETRIILHRNSETLLTLPYSHTPIYKKDAP